ncbi:MAG: hypothetical protein ACOWWO_16875 [Peptococcaceae bacterium]
MKDKQAEILNEFNRARLNEEAVNIEKVYFYKTDKRVNPRQEDPFWLAVGEVPVLVSAPHAVRHYRQKKIKMSDQFTGSLVYLLNRLTGCHGIAAAKLYGGDPNWDNPCIYKEKLTDFCSRQKIKFLLDIHGAARERAFDVDLGTNGEQTLRGKGEILKTLAQNFKDFGLTKVSFDNFAVSDPHTVVNYVAREVGIPSVQIEINKQYRVPAQNPRGFHCLLGALVESIKGLT